MRTFVERTIVAPPFEFDAGDQPDAYGTADHLHAIDLGVALHSHPPGSARLRKSARILAHRTLPSLPWIDRLREVA